MNIAKVLCLPISICLANNVVGADETYSGTISSIGNHPASADPAYTESWSWLQLSGVTGASGCASGDEGAGDLAYLAVKETEQYLSTMILSAYLSEKMISVTVDGSNLYEGNCLIKKLVLAPQVALTVLDLEYPSLVASYSMDNIVASNFNDLKGTADGSVTGASIAPGYIGNSLDFSGNPITNTVPTDFVEFDNEQILSGDFTLSLWFRADGNKQHSAILGSPSDADSHITLIESGQFKVKINGSVYNSSVNFGSFGTTWHHLAVVRSGTIFSVYLDRVLFDEFSASAEDLPYRYLGIYHELGSGLHSTWAYDQLRFFDEALQEEQIIVLGSE